VSRVSDATYRRRRAVVGTALAAFVAVGAVTTYDVLAGSGSVPASAAVSQPARSTTVAQPGDSLWSIAERHHGDVPLVRYVDKLVALNGGATIQVGQLVTLP
jgi:LysM repeat protein